MQPTQPPAPSDDQPQPIVPTPPPAGLTTPPSQPIQAPPYAPVQPAVPVQAAPPVEPSAAVPPATVAAPEAQPAQSNWPPAQAASYQPAAAAPLAVDHRQRRLWIIIAAVIGGLVLIGAVVLLFVVSANSNKAQPAASSTAPSDNGPATDAPAAVEQPADQPAAAAQSNEVALDKSFTDQIGYKISVTRLVRDYPASSKYTAQNLAENKRELVLVDYKIESTSQDLLGGNPLPSRLIIKSSDGSESRQTYDVSQAELKEAGYTPLPINSMKPGETSSGVVAYEVAKGDKLTLFYHLQTRILGGEDVDKEYSLELY